MPRGIEQLIGCVSQKLQNRTDVSNGLTIDEQARIDELNREAVEDHQKAYFPIKYVELILFDIIPITRRNEFLLALKSIVKDRKDENIRFVEKSRIGSRGGGWNAPLTVDERKLPKAFLSAEVMVGQSFSFCLYFMCSAVVPQEFEQSLRESFMKSGLWSASKKQTNPAPASFSRSIEDTDRTILSLQTQLEEFLSKIPGIFLSGPRKSKEDVLCPSIRVLESSQFEINNFPKWFQDRTEFLRYLELWPFLSLYRDLVLGYQGRKLGGLDIPSGLVIVRLMKDEEGNSIESNYPVDPLWLITEYFAPFLVCLYWCRLTIEVMLPNWESKIDMLNTEFQTLMQKGSSKMSKSVELYMETVAIENHFETFALDELKKLREMRRNFMIKRTNLPLSKPLGEGNLSFDVLKDLTEGVRFIREEADDLLNLRRKAQSMTAQYRNYSEFALQKNMRVLTKRALLVSLASLLIALVALLFHFF